jgi:hypothetical protein
LSHFAARAIDCLIGFVLNIAVNKAGFMNWRLLSMLLAVTFLCLLFYWNNESLRADIPATSPAATSVSASMRIESNKAAYRADETILFRVQISNPSKIPFKFDASSMNTEYFYLLIKRMEPGMRELCLEFNSLQFLTVSDLISSRRIVFRSDENISLQLPLLINSHALEPGD